MLYCPRRGEISPKALGLGKDVALGLGKDVAVVIGKDVALEMGKDVALGMAKDVALGMGKDVALEVGKGPLSPLVMGKEPLGVVQETQPSPEAMDFGDDSIE